MISRDNIFRRVGQIASINSYVDTVAAEQNIRNNIFFRGPNVWILTFSIVIASVGLNVNSIPVIIGAMLISPLMGPIFGLGLGLGINDMQLLKDSFKNLVIMMGVSLVASTIYFVLTPLTLTNPTELLARTTPTIFDVFIALFGGLAGTLEMARKEKGTVFSGVAIATALMPPLCTAGYGIASASLTDFAGALYLFCINCIFIVLATYVMVKYLRFKNKSFEDIKIARKTKAFISLFLVLFIVPSIISAILMIRENNFNQNASQFVEENKIIANSYIYDYKISHHNGSTLTIFLAGEVIDEKDMLELYKSAARYGLQETQLIINDKSTRNSSSNELEILRDIYAHNESEILDKNSKIYELERELEAIKSRTIPYTQIANEVRMIYPEIEAVAVTYGANVLLESSDSLLSQYVVVVRADTIPADVTRLTDWFKVRLSAENLSLFFDLPSKDEYLDER